MAPTIGQIAAGSYVKVLNEARKPENQWSENGFLREAERQGFIEMISFGNGLEVALDYRRNPGAKFLSNELEAVSTSATEVLTSATADFAEISVPVFWSKKTEVANPTTSQKVPIVKSLLMNGFDSHDDLIEEAIFATSTNGFLGLVTHVPIAGTGTDHAIDSGTETWWRCAQSTYVDDTDIVSALTSSWNSASKASGSKTQPTLLVSDGATQALFEGTQQANQRWVDTDELKVGFKILAFKTARYVFSQYGNTKIYGLNPKSFKIKGSKEYFRDKGEVQEMDNANGFGFKIYSALQTIVTNRSRLFVVHT